MMQRGRCSRSGCSTKGGFNLPSVDEARQTQLRNIEKDYGKTIDELVGIVTDSGLTNHNDAVAMLKQRFGMSHGSAHRVSLIARSRSAQAPGKPTAPLSPNMSVVYEKLLGRVMELGDDIEQAPKSGYVSLRRRKQFAMLQPGAKWINVGLILRENAPAGPQKASGERLEPAAKWNAMFTHRVRVTTVAEIDAELESWLRAAYVAAA